VLDLSNGQKLAVPLPEFGGEPFYQPRVCWFGNDHILVLSSGRLCRYGLDGSREVLYP